MEKSEGGLTAIEKKAFTELALGAGSREAIVYSGPELSVATFDIDSVKKANESSHSSAVNRRKEGYFMFILFALVLGVLLWFRN